MFKRLPLLFFIFHIVVKAQNDPVNRSNFQIEISPTNEEIVIDGEKREEICLLHRTVYSGKVVIHIRGIV